MISTATEATAALAASMVPGGDVNVTDTRHSPGEPSSAATRVGRGAPATVSRPRAHLATRLLLRRQDHERSRLSGASEGAPRAAAPVRPCLDWSFDV
jgi:hypothetical protein